MAHLNPEKSRIVEMAWEAGTPFEAIEVQYSLYDPAVIIFMRKQLQHRNFKRQQKWFTGRKTKHQGIGNPSVSHAYCSTP
jgi:uncharacterized protein (TIGR03643 family)